MHYDPLIKQQLAHRASEIRAVCNLPINFRWVSRADGTHEMDKLVEKLISMGTMSTRGSGKVFNKGLFLISSIQSLL